MNKTYSGFSDLHAGMKALPVWAQTLHPGTFVNISKNVLKDAKPSAWPSTITDTAGPFNNWSGGVFAHDYGEHGGYAIMGGGHLSAGYQLTPGVWVFDVATGMWSIKSGPAQPIFDQTTPMNDFGESTDPATFGHPSSPHTYHGLVYRSKEHGGGPSGSVLRNFFAGTSWKGSHCVHEYKLLNTHDVPVRVVDRINTRTNYPCVGLDLKRRGYWAMAYDLSGSMFFVSFDDFRQIEFTGLDQPAYGNYRLIHVPTHDILVAVGDGVDFGPPNFKVWVSKIDDFGIPGKFKAVTLGGDWRIGDYSGRMGGVYSEILGCIVCYKAEGNDYVWRLNIPDDYLNAVWTMNKEFLAGVEGATWDNYSVNGTWSRFVEAPNLRCFLYCGSVNGPVIAFKLAGM